ncbi:MAG: glycosyltransferase family 2 protein [Longimicrobiales bacterium]
MPYRCSRHPAGLAGRLRSNSLEKGPSSMIECASLVSVVIPTYNRRLRVMEAVKSVLGQTYPHFEIVVVDDGSEDGTADAIASLDDMRLRVIREQKRSGGATARNIGIDEAKAHLIAFLDSDDIWMPKKLELQTSFLLSRDQPSVSLTYTDLVYSDHRGRRVMSFRTKAEVEPVGDYLFLNWGRNFIQTSTIMLPTELARRVRFRDGLRIHQDWDFVLRAERIGARFEVLSVPLTLVNAELRSDRISTGSDAAPSLEWLETVRDLLSPRAHAAFRAHQVPRLADRKPFHAAGAVVGAFSKGAIGTGQCLSMLKWCVREFMAARPGLRPLVSLYRRTRLALPR